MALNKDQKKILAAMLGKETEKMSLSVTQKKVLKKLVSKKMGRAALCKSLGLPPGPMARCLDSLYCNGLVTEKGGGEEYTITPAGREAIG